MQVVILAGWLGTRLSEETVIKPKPMVEIWWKPILWHIMKMYSHYGYKNFTIALWYKGYYIKEWFYNYFLHNSDLTIDIKNNNIDIHTNTSEDWKVTLVDTWSETQTWWRIKKIIEWWYIKDDEFMLTYWDWVSDVNIGELIKFHNNHWKLATLTAVQPESRFWKLTFEWNKIIEFWEKKDNIEQYVNGWFMVLNKKIINYIDNDFVPLESSPLERLASEWNLIAFKHDWFWYAMDTLRHKQVLEEMWNKWNAPWKIY